MDKKDYAERLKTVGRNDPCPCGSGRKYKHCHHTEDRAAEHDALAQAAEERAKAEAAADAEDAAEGGTSGKAHKTKGQAREDHHQHKKGGKGSASSATLPRRGAI